MGLFSGPGVTPSLKGLPTNRIALAPGEVFNLPSSEATWAMIKPGLYTAFQSFDPILQAWKNVGGTTGGSMEYVYMDGTTNYRFANQTHCVVGALITAVGSGYNPASPPTVTATVGGSIWRAIVGGAISATVVISNGGQNYTYPPTVVISAPPPGGIQATAYATLTTGSVSGITVVDQGAGYASPPTITLINDPREGVNGVAQGYGASAVCTLTGAGTITGLVCVDHGSPFTSTTAVPTLSFSSGAATATAIVCWSITGYTPTAGTGFTGPSLLSGLDAFPGSAAGVLNTSTQQGLVKTRMAQILMPESGGAPTATGAVFYDGGIYTGIPTPLVTTNGALITQTATFAFAMGGYVDTSLFTPV